MKKFIVAVAAASMALPVYAADLGGRVLNIGSDTTYPPHEFIEDGVVKGFDVDVVAEICERINCTPNWLQLPGMVFSRHLQMVNLIWSFRVLQ